MPLFLSKKNKIQLEDYNYKRDVDTRLLLANLNFFEMQLLQEIIDHSLIIPIKQLAQILSVKEEALYPPLEKLLLTKLFKIENKNLLVDKEARRYLESHIVKFDESFEPGIDYLQGLINKIPIQHVQNWYSIPKTSDHIFLYLVEKNLSSPKIYDKYLEEIKADHPQLKTIIEDLHSAPDFSLTASAIMEKHHLTHAEFQELALLIEYNLLGCLAYKKEEDKYVEIITPYCEWKTYLKFKNETSPQSIQDISNISRRHPENFGFIQEMSLVVEMGLKKPLPCKLSSPPSQYSKEFFEAIVQKILFHRFGELKEGKLFIFDSGKEWLEKPILNKALTFSRHPIKVEKSLRRVLGKGWFYVDDFIKGFTGILPGKDPIQLKQKGKKWRYILPEYTEEELQLIETTLCERLFEAGVVATGTHKGRKCFTVTPFGKSILED